MSRIKIATVFRDDPHASMLAHYARERGEETFRRLWLLEKKGFYRETAASFQGDAMWLLHCTSKQPKIILYPDGKVVATGTNARINRHTEDHDADRIENFNDEDAQLFNEWIASVPMPNAWQRTKKFRDDVTAWGCLALLFGGWMIVWSFIGKLFKS